MDPYIGQIILFAGKFNPVGWQNCEGQLLSIADYSPLYSLIGTTYGGNGSTNFALPDLRGRAPIHVGKNPSGSNYLLGQIGGVENVTLTLPQIPVHTHPSTLTGVAATSATATKNTPGGNILAQWVDGSTGAANAIYATPATTPSTPLSGPATGGTTGVAGSSQAHSDMQPYLPVRYIIALVGVWPQHP